MEALERMFEDSEDEVTTYEVDTEDEELEDLNEFDVELIEFIGDQLDEITDEELDEELDGAIGLLEKKIKRSKKPWEAKGMSKSEYKKFLKQKAKDWKKDKAGQKRAAKAAKKRAGKKPKFTFSHYDPSEDDSIVKLAQRVLQQHTEVEGDEELSEEDEQILDVLIDTFSDEEVEEISEMSDEEFDTLFDELLDEDEELDEVKKIKRQSLAKRLKSMGISKGEYKKRLKKQAKQAKKYRAKNKGKLARAAAKRQKPGYKPKFQFKDSYDPTDDVNALIGDTELSEEFKTKASTIFEAAVNREVESQVGDLDFVLEELLVECGGELKEEMAQEVDKYLNYVVEEWMEENKLAVESGIQNELSENFMTGLKQLFTENYVDIPETKVDVVSELANKVQELEADLETKLTENIELKESLGDLKRDDLIRSISGDLVETEIDKVKELSSGVDYTGDDEEFIANVQTLKESYFPKGKVNSPVSETDTVQEVDYENLSDSMTAYTNALSRVLK